VTLTGEPFASRRNVVADHGSTLEQVLVLGEEPVDTRGQQRLHGGRHLDGAPRPRAS